MIKKQTFNTCGTYIAPECIALELKVQGMVCTSLNSAMLLEEATNDNWGEL
jgi:hypothetical protein